MWSRAHSFLWLNFQEIPPACERVVELLSYLRGTLDGIRLFKAQEDLTALTAKFDFNPLDRLTIELFENRVSIPLLNDIDEDSQICERIIAQAKLSRPFSVKLLRRTYLLNIM